MNGPNGNDSNHGFWDREPEDRAYRMERAADAGGVDNFFDLAAEERAAAYEGWADDPL